IKIGSVLDVGCGAGEWKRESYTGIDYKVPKRILMIEPDQYIDFDLRYLNTKKEIELKSRSLKSKYDTVICLEVAEHLPISSAMPLVKFLCSMSDRVLFSAAIPY